MWKMLSRFAHNSLAFRAVPRRFFSSSNSVLVLAEHDNQKLSDVTLSAVTAAKKLGGNVSVLVAGASCNSVASQAAKLSGVGRVLVADNAAYAHAGAENLSSLVQHVQKQNNFTHVVCASTSTGKSVIPRAAVTLDSAPITDVVEIKSADTFVRPIYAGNALSTVRSKDAVKFITVRPTNFEKTAVADQEAKVESAPLPEQPDLGLTTWLKDTIQKSDRPELSSARIVVAGGRGLKSGENFQLLYSLADVLNAAVGASRAAVDAGYVSNELQVGQTGKVVAPDLYIAVGISGAIQHLAGMKDSKTIVAINKDAEAPIFQVADYGIVGDLFKVVPELTAELQKQKS
eukprot:TRINITY_DN1305_c0_g1_i1.p1 TRINITY_DN1305_c0_g1~~TRINITY_DN1305_c0_g1_i1.p1  ORF type:complete len:345 (+),score=133.66 TRINITY_DN1305_c0_g1_i1:52-1086(+)